MPFVLKVAVVLVLIAIIFSLGSGMVFMLKDGGKSTRNVKALSVRIGLSVTLFLLLLLYEASGHFHPAQKPMSPPVTSIDVEHVQ